MKECRTKECGINFEKLHLIRKIKLRIFNSMAVIFYLLLHILSYLRVIYNLNLLKNYLMSLILSSVQSGIK